jgi:hypothetical protein
MRQRLKAAVSHHKGFLLELRGDRLRRQASAQLQVVGPMGAQGRPARATAHRKPTSCNKRRARRVTMRWKKPDSEGRGRSSFETGGGEAVRRDEEPPAVNLGGATNASILELER